MIAKITDKMVSYQGWWWYERRVQNDRNENASGSILNSDGASQQRLTPITSRNPNHHHLGHIYFRATRKDMATIQFDRIYHGVTAELGSELFCVKFEEMNIIDEVLCRISSSSERNGVEGR